MELLLAGTEAWDWIQVSKTVTQNAKHPMGFLKPLPGWNKRLEIQEGQERHLKGESRSSSNLEGSWGETEWGWGSRTGEDKGDKDRGDQGQRRVLRRTGTAAATQWQRDPPTLTRDRAHSDARHTDVRAPTRPCGTVRPAAPRGCEEVGARPGSPDGAESS